MHDTASRRGKARLSLLVLVLLAFGLVVIANSVFIDSCFVHWVEPGEEESREGLGLENICSGLTLGLFQRGW